MNPVYSETQLINMWTKVLSVIQIESSAANFFTLFNGTKLLSLEENTATIAVPSTIIIDLIKKRFLTLIKNTIDRHTNKNITIVFVPKSISPQLPDKIGPLFIEDAQKVIAPPDSLPRVRPDYIFETLAVSSSNQLAFVSATTVAKNPGKSYNPLFIYGPVGVGKTHLMQAIANDVHKNNPRKKIVYITSEEFTNEVVEAIRTNQTQTMKKRFRTAFLLIIDDIQFLAGKERVQEELFHTFNILIDNATQVVLSSDRPPSEIKKLEGRLSSRFSGGLTVDIESPDFELRTAILLIKAKKQGVQLPIDAAKKIALHIKDTRLLEGVLLRIITEAKTQNKDIEEIVELKIPNLGQQGGERHVHTEDVIKNVCDFYAIKTTMLKGPKRNSSLVKARQVCMYLLKTELGLTLVEIGNILGGRDHTTIMHGVGKIEGLLSQNPKLREEISGINVLLR